MKHIPESIKQAAKNLRNNSTKSEIILWNYLKQEQLGVKFLRQKPVFVFTEDAWWDRFIIADFYCPEYKLIIELDGSIHNIKEIYELDRKKEELVSKRWITVLRFTNRDIEKNIKAVLQKISLFLKGSTPKGGGILNNKKEVLTRCAWVNPNNELYVKYHDEEWGKPVHDDRVLFEFLILEWAQAGLSWETVLRKRENYRAAFDGFDYEKIANYDEKKIEELLLNEWIIRNKLKVKSAIKNAKAFIEIRKEYGSFSKYLWWYVDGKQIVNRPKALSEVPVSTKLSDTMSKDLKKRGMSFVGTTIMYAYLQAVWIVNDHVIDCFCKK